jgi:hypothetical protein
MDMLKELRKPLFCPPMPGLPKGGREVHFIPFRSRRTMVVSVDDLGRCEHTGCHAPLFGYRRICPFCGRRLSNRSYGRKKDGEREAWFNLDLTTKSLCFVRVIERPSGFCRVILGYLVEVIDYDPNGVRPPMAA